MAIGGAEVLGLIAEKLGLDDSVWNTWSMPLMTILAWSATRSSRSSSPVGDVIRRVPRDGARQDQRVRPKRIVTVTCTSEAVMLGGKAGSTAPRIIASTAASRSGKPVLPTTA
jgi:hypothetical protein